MVFVNYQSLVFGVSLGFFWRMVCSEFFLVIKVFVVLQVIWMFIEKTVLVVKFAYFFVQYGFFFYLVRLYFFVTFICVFFWFVIFFVILNFIRVRSTVGFVFRCIFGNLVFNWCSQKGKIKLIRDRFLIMNQYILIGFCFVKE